MDGWCCTWQPDLEAHPCGFVEDGLRMTVIDLRTKDVPNLETIGDGVVMLGGRMDALAEDRHPWLPRVKDLLADAQGMDVPVLGICLGHQVLADALGGEVTVADPRGLEEGPVRLEWTADAADDPVLGGMVALGDGPVRMSHYDAVTRLPEGAVELARSEAYGNQAFRLGSALGVQFHPEASPELMQHWWHVKHGGWNTAMLDRMRQVDDELARSCRTVAEGFARQVYAG
ncbi:type 1 glutamine amidotransferase [Nigerium massiliense]|uniref:type 1 glutamine amidotransferase n=1 Tax=Nigerium massiliense TaxID=1522317 RepID=UPI0011C8A227|nr:type 1 glutamine amidotransferase [Nigerium massiliense]